MKQFLVFSGECHEASGGWSDLLGEADSLDEARSMARRYDEGSGGADIWWHIVDTKESCIVLQEFQDPGTPSTARELRTILQKA